jgi:hypothetical protein
MARDEELTMWMRTLVSAVILAGGCLGQNGPAKAGGAPAAESRYFHLDFVVKELEGGKTINARAHAMSVAIDGGRNSVRSGNRVPMSSGPPGTPGVSYTYLDIGTNIDCWNVKEAQGQLTLMVSAEVSTAVHAADAPAPIIRQVKWNAPAIVPLRKPTVIFSSDDPSSDQGRPVVVVRHRWSRPISGRTTTNAGPSTP